MNPSPSTGRRGELQAEGPSSRRHNLNPIRPCWDHERLARQFARRTEQLPIEQDLSICGCGLKATDAPTRTRPFGQSLHLAGIADRLGRSRSTRLATGPHRLTRSGDALGGLPCRREEDGFAAGAHEGLLKVGLSRALKLRQSSSSRAKPAGSNRREADRGLRDARLRAVDPSGTLDGPCPSSPARPTTDSLGFVQPGDRPNRAAVRPLRRRRHRHPRPTPCRPRLRGRC